MECLDSGEGGVVEHNGMLDRTKGWAGRGIKGLESHTHLADLCRRVDILLDAIENGAIVGQENAISLTATTAEGFGLAPSRARSQRAGTLGGGDGRVGHPYCVVKGAFRSEGDGELASSMLAIRVRRRVKAEAKPRVGPGANRWVRR